VNVIEIATCINVYKSAIDPSDFMHEIEKETDNPWSEVEWLTSSVGLGSVSSYRTSAEANITHLEHSQTALAQKFSGISKRILDEILPDYREQYIVSTSGYEGWRLLKYSGGGEYHAHYDHAPLNQRIVSVVAFLQSPESGGQLEFPFFDVTIDAEAGDVVVFPSNFPYVHIAHPVMSGTKCSLVTWLQ
jgi:predicted 2-oxoglutarate/Fe(II)-dependent dioxygenase YbiX